MQYGVFTRMKRACKAAIPLASTVKMQENCLFVFQSGQLKSLCFQLLKKCYLRANVAEVKINSYRFIFLRSKFPRWNFCFAFFAITSTWRQGGEFIFWTF